jgi:RNA polymerase sigma-70 factor, ECF subfamily
MTLHDNATPDFPAWNAENAIAALLMERAKAGDAEAFAQLYSCTSRWLLARIRRFVGNSCAEDVLAEVYIQAWKELHRYDASRGHVGAWLAVIARSRALDWLRREERMRVTHDASSRMDLACDDVGLSPEDIASTLESWRLLQSHIAQALTDKERLVIRLAYFRDNTHSEIAEATGMPLGTVKTLMRRAQLKLRERMAPTSMRFGARTEARVGAEP